MRELRKWKVDFCGRKWLIDYNCFSVFFYAGRNQSIAIMQRKRKKGATCQGRFMITYGLRFSIK